MNMASAGETVIHAGRLMAEAGQGVTQGASVRIAGGKIAEIAAGFVDPPEGVRLIDL